MFYRCLVVGVVSCVLGCVQSADLDSEDSASAQDADTDTCLIRVPGAAGYYPYLRPTGSAQLAKDRRDFVDVETVYLPHVVRCEMTAAEGESAMTLAIAARSYLYGLLAYNFERSSNQHLFVPSLDGVRQQQFFCDRNLSKIIEGRGNDQYTQAVHATRGQVLLNKSTIVIAKYGSGHSNVDPNDCVTNDSFRATHNDVNPLVAKNMPPDQLRNERLRMTMKTWHDASDSVVPVAPEQPCFHGRLSQNGTYCFANAGIDHESILKFYYGFSTAIRQLPADIKDKICARFKE